MPQDNQRPLPSQIQRGEESNASGQAETPAKPDARERGLMSQHHYIRNPTMSGILKDGESLVPQHHQRPTKPQIKDTELMPQRNQQSRQTRDKGEVSNVTTPPDVSSNQRQGRGIQYHNTTQYCSNPDIKENSLIPQHYQIPYQARHVRCKWFMKQCSHLNMDGWMGGQPEKRHMMNGQSVSRHDVVKVCMMVGL